MNSTGTQRIVTAFNPSVPFTVYLDADIFNAPGTYTLFNYNGASFPFAPYASEQALLNARMTISVQRAGLVAIDPNGTVNTAAKTITVTLVPQSYAID